MQEHTDDWSNTPDGPSRKKSRTRTMLLRFLFTGLGSVLLLAVAVAAMVPQLASLQKMYAAPQYGGYRQHHRYGQNQNQTRQDTIYQTKQSTTSGLTTLQLDPDAETLAIRAIVFDAPSNIPLVMHVHRDGSCTGPIFFTLEATSDDVGHASATKTFNGQQDTTIPSNWFFNVHDTTKQGPDGKPLSIACGPIQTIDATTGFAKLNPVQQSSPTPTPTPSTSGDLTTLKTTTTTQSTTHALTTLQLDPNAATLTIQAIVFGAPSNKPLVLHVHGDGSCMGPKFFIMEATSDNAGNAYATKTFSQDANSNPLPTTLPSNWFFNIHDTTRLGPDGKPLSIACGPIKMPDPSGLRGFALACPVQQSQATEPAKPASAPQSTTQGLAVLYLNPTAHTLNVLVHVTGAPPNTPLTMNIHGDRSCTGPTRFMLQTVSDNTGNASAIMPFDDQEDTMIPSNWFFNVHNITKQGPDGQSQSIACGPIQTPGQVGLAQLSPA